VIYTYLKRVSYFAVVPGSLVGAIPAFMGWAAAGGSIFQPTIIFIAFFLFIWQIPHFWLLMIKYGKEYEDAGFKTINQEVSPVNLKIIIFAWVLATSFSSIIVPLFLTNISLPFFLIIFALNLSFIGIFTRLSFGNVAELNFRKSFVSINIYMMLFMLMLIVFHMVA
jgi:protoheme IX farnesyltransferase